MNIQTLNYVLLNTRATGATPQSVQPPRHGLDHRDIGVRLPDGAKYFPLLHSTLVILGLTLSPIQGVKVKVKLTLEHDTKAQRGTRGIALLFL